jgi:cephalosporin hydroxylase
MIVSVAKRYREAFDLLRKDPRRFFRSLRRLVGPMRRDYRRRFGMSLRRWLLYHHHEILHRQCYWMGARALKNPFDAWIYQEILYEVQPDVVIEIGSNEGGSTLFLAHMLELIGKGEVVSVDIDRSRFRVSHDRIVTVTGDSSADATVAQVAALCEGKRGLVIHDADHNKAPVLRDLRAYERFVSVGSYLIVEDGIVDLFRPGDGLGWFAEGPLAAIEEFVRERPEFEVDKARERYVMTYNPKGFLRRVS